MGKDDDLKAYTLAGSVTHLLHRAQQAAVNLSAEGLSEKNLTIRQFAVLAALHDEDGQSQSNLVDQTGIDRSTLADMVSRMEKGGLIKRVTSKEDARAKAVSLTKSGLKAYTEAVPDVERADKTLLAVLRSSRRESLIAALTLISDEFDPADFDPDLKSRKSRKNKKKKKK